MKHKNWFCQKCETKEYEVGEMRVSGSFWQKIFNVQRSIYGSITCQRCKYTEFYKVGSKSKLGDVFDFFTT